MTKKIKISEKMSKHLFLNGLGKPDNDNDLYTKMKFIKNKKTIAEHAKRNG
jgi:hypothetical protein